MTALELYDDDVVAASASIDVLPPEPDPVEVLEKALEAGEEIWEASIDAGNDAREKGDQKRWRIGDLARLVNKKYGKNRIGEWAKAINHPVASVKEYRTTCGFWTKAVRTDLLDLPGITYSHMKLAKRLKDLDRAREFIEACAMNSWTIEQAKFELAKLLGPGKTVPAKLIDAEAEIRSVEVSPDKTHATVALTLLPGVDMTDLEHLRKGRIVRVVMREVEDEGDGTADS